MVLYRAYSVHAAGGVRGESTGLPLKCSLHFLYFPRTLHCFKVVDAF